MICLKEKIVLYLEIKNKFPVNRFSWLRFNFQVKLVIYAKVDFMVEKVLLRSATPKQSLCSKPTRKLC